MPISILTPILTTPNLHPTHKNLTQKLQASDKDAQQARNAKMADAAADIQPTAFVADHPEEIHGQDVAEGRNEHEQAAGGHAQAAGQDSQIGADEREGDEEFQDEEGALGKGVEDGDESVDGVEGEGGDGGDVAG